MNKVVAVKSKKIARISFDKIASEIYGGAIKQVLIFDKDYNIVDPKLPISSPIYNWDMLQMFAKMLVNAEHQNRLVVIDTSNSALSVSNDILTDLYKYIGSNYASMIKVAFSRLWVYAGPSLFLVSHKTGELLVSPDYGKDTILTAKQIEQIKQTIDNLFNEIEAKDSNLLKSFRAFISSMSKGGQLPYTKTKDGYFWNIPCNLNGENDYPLSLHLRTDPNDIGKVLQVTFKELVDKNRANSFIDEQKMPDGLRSWLLSTLQSLVGDQFQITEGGKTSVNFNMKGFDTKINAINDLQKRLDIENNEIETIYVGDEAKILPDNHPGNDAIVFSLPNIRLVNTGSLNDGSRSLETVKLSDFGLSKGRGTQLFNMNLSHGQRKTSALQVTLEVIKNWFL